MSLSLFPELLPADSDERRRALDPHSSFIVQAPAGSGKTELLIQRVLRLLALVDEPEEIVAITFTKKAAAQMQARVLDALRGAQAGTGAGAAHQRFTRQLAQDALSRDQARGWHLLQQPQRLAIETFDALAHRFTRAMPWHSRFGAMPQPVEDASELYHAAAALTLRLLGDGSSAAQAMRRVLAHVDNQVENAERLIAEMLARRDQWLPLVANTRDASLLRPELERNLAQIIQRELERVYDAAPSSQLPSLPLPRAEYLAAWRDIAQQLLTNKGDWRKKEPRAQALQAAGAETFREALHEIRRLPATRYSDEQFALLAALFDVLLHGAAHLNSVFQSRGQVDFTAIALAALRALGLPDQPSDLAFSLGHRIQHLLVDEFQDTSEIQRQFLLRLTAGWENGDGRTLFVVGDPMQSIYRFRRAEVGLFLDIRQSGLGALRLQPLTLRVNFRSRAPLVAWVNRAFQQIFPATEDARLGAVPYVESVAFAEEAVGAGAATPPPAVYLHPRLGIRDHAREAHDVAHLVAEARHRDATQSIAILVRSRAHLTAIVDEFRRRGWRYRAVKVDTLAERPVVRDLLALCRALVHLADRPAWLAVLRAPWCGLTLHDLHALVGGDLQGSLWNRLQSACGRLSPDGQLRAARFVEAMDAALKLRRRQPLRMVLESLWVRLGGPSALHSASARADAEAFLHLLDTHVEGGDVPAFDRLEKRLTELFAQPDLEADDRLQLMTIHQAKGLEFDTVIVPGLHRTSRPEEPPLLRWLDWAEPDGARVLLAPKPQTGSDPIYDFLRRQESRQDSHEVSRLLYVALTRARRELHLFGAVDIRSARLSMPDSRSFLGRLWPVVEPDFANLVLPAAPTPDPQPPPDQTLWRLPAGWQPAPSPAPLRWHSPAPAEPPDPITFDWAGPSLRVIGIVVHRYLQRIAREGLDAWPPSRVAASRGSLRTALLSLGLPPSTLASASDRVEEALLAVLADERGRWILSPHPESASEWAVSGVVRGRVWNVVMDRTFVVDGVRWIVDFKTSAHEGAQRDAFLDNEQLRYQAQLERYAELMRLSDPRPIRLGLYFPLLRGWREWTP
jgi:ATP-dependent exoDNAse (exonuclease V) beta subunit